MKNLQFLLDRVLDLLFDVGRTAKEEPRDAERFLEQLSLHDQNFASELFNAVARHKASTEFGSANDEV